jgi:hypothetical protein
MAPAGSTTHSQSCQDKETAELRTLFSDDELKTFFTPGELRTLFADEELGEAGDGDGAPSGELSSAPQALGVTSNTEQYDLAGEDEEDEDLEDLLYEQCDWSTCSPLAAEEETILLHEQIFEISAHEQRLAAAEKAEEAILLHEQIFEISAHEQRLAAEEKARTKMETLRFSVPCCPAEHVLTKKKADGEYECDHCGRDITEGKRFYDCRRCDFSMCCKCCKNTDRTVVQTIEVPQINEDFEEINLISENPMDIVYEIVAALGFHDREEDGWVNMAQVISMARHRSLMDDTVFEAIDEWKNLNVMIFSPKKNMVKFIVKNMFEQELEDEEMYGTPRRKTFSSHYPLKK